MMFMYGKKPIPNETEPIAYNGVWEELYTFCNREDADNIMIGKKDPSKLRPGFHYADAPGVRLIPLDHCMYLDDPRLFYDGDGPDIGLFRDGYIWCGTGYTKDNRGRVQLLPFGANWGPDVKYAYPNWFDCLETIHLQYANYVYVVDDVEYQSIMAEWFDKDPPKEVVSEALFARAKTIVPINEYDRSFVDPFVIIRRNLMFDEIVSVDRI